MKFPLSLALFGLLALTSCEIDEPPVRNTRRPVPRYPNPQQSQYPAPQQPFQDPSQTAPPTTPPQDPITQAPTEQQSAPAPTAPPTAKGDYPYGVPVAGKPGFVRSPYSPDKMTDVRGYAPGTEVKDPYTQKIFLVP
jgi:hypothetical protein